VESYIDKIDIPIYIHHHEPSGIGSNWNNCVAKSNGEYIKFLFQDDLLNEDCIEKMTTCALLDRNISLVLCERNILFDKNTGIDLWVNKWLKSYSNLFEKWPIEIKDIHCGNDLLRRIDISKLNENKFGEPTCALIKKSDLENISGFDLSLKQLLDLEGWYRLIRDRKVFFINENLASFRLHENQESLRFSKSDNYEGSTFDGLVFQHCYDQLNIKTRALLFLKINHLFIFRIVNFFFRKLKFYST
jgi:glycosyltransferase involved in cell wall biosynthesis